MYLGPDGLIGRHETMVQQLFAVVAGQAWVSGADGQRRTLEAGYAARWQVGEMHEAGSDEGATAICVEGRFDMWAVEVTSDIVVVAYDPEWPGWFEALRQRVWPAVADVALRIDHVG